MEAAPSRKNGGQSRRRAGLPVLRAASRLAPPALTRRDDRPRPAFLPALPADQAAIEKLDEHAFGPGRFARTAYRLREGVEPDLSLSFVARVGTLLVGANG